MPVLRFLSPDDPPSAGFLREVSELITTELGIDPGHCWAMWLRVAEGGYHRPEWQLEGARGPVIFLTCKASYSPHVIARLLPLVAESTAERVGCDPGDVYIAVQRAAEHELFVRGAIWHRDGD
ncbi:MAG: hypothetical protein QOE53_389 [Pseudonocardiales bacterium]|jgi:hypothetical protein|nr:hypothetical protein [Pseudonocardiales bacterium]